MKLVSAAFLTAALVVWVQGCSDRNDDIDARRADGGRWSTENDRAARDGTGQVVNMDAAMPRISVGDARQRVDSGAALLVCAYDNDMKFRRNHLSGAISLYQLQDREASLAKDQELIFYCA